MRKVRDAWSLRRSFQSCCRTIRCGGYTTRELSVTVLLDGSALPSSVTPRFTSSRMMLRSVGVEIDVLEDLLPALAVMDPADVDLAHGKAEVHEGKDVLRMLHEENHLFPVEDPGLELRRRFGERRVSRP